jgi:hypothetical protein
VSFQYDSATRTQVSSDAQVAACIASAAVLSAAEATLGWLLARQSEEVEMASHEWLRMEDPNVYLAEV